MKAWALILVAGMLPGSAAAQDFGLGPVDDRISAVTLNYGPERPTTQPAAHETLEWAAADSDLIVRGQVEAPLFDRTNPLPSTDLLTFRFPWARNYPYVWPYAPLQIRVTETLKAPVQTRVAFDAPTGWRDPRERWIFTDPEDGRRPPRHATSRT